MGVAKVQVAGAYDRLGRQFYAVVHSFFNSKGQDLRGFRVVGLIHATGERESPGTP